MISILKRLFGGITFPSLALSLPAEHLRPVRQGEFAIARATDIKHVLTTENVWTCTAFVGIDKVNGVAFLCHVDWPPSRASVQRLVQRVRDEAGDTAKFEVCLVTGVWRGWTWITPLVVAASFLAINPANWGWMLFVMLIILAGLGITRFILWLQLSRLHAFDSLPGIVGCSNNALGWGKSGVSVDAAKSELHPVRSYWRRREFDRYKPLKGQELGIWTESKPDVGPDE